MKRVFSLMIIVVLIIQLSSCGLNIGEKATETLYLKNHINNSGIEIKVNAERIFGKNDMSFGIKSQLSIDEMKKSLEKNNPDFTFEVLDDEQILMESNGESPYTLFTKNVIDTNNNPVEDVYIVTSESASTNKDNIGIHFPYHLVNAYFTLKESEDNYSINCNLPDFFFKAICMRDSQNTIGNLVRYYRKCNYSVEHIGGNLNGGVINITPKTEDAVAYKILVMRNGNNCAIQFGNTTVTDELFGLFVINDYFDSLNTKDYQSYLSCFENSDGDDPDAFFNNVQSADLLSEKLIWSDISRSEAIFEVNFRLNSKDNKMMGSYGTGELDILEYWTINQDNKTSTVIKSKYSNIHDSISNLNIYQDVKFDTIITEKDLS